MYSPVSMLLKYGHRRHRICDEINITVHENKHKNMKQCEGKIDKKQLQQQYSRQECGMCPLSYLVCVYGDALHDKLDVAEHLVIYVILQVRDLRKKYFNLIVIRETFKNEY